MDIMQNVLPDKPEEVSASLGSAMDNAAICGLMKQYAKFLMKKGLATDKEIVKQKIGAVLSPALDSGVVTQAIISNVFSWIDTELCGNSVQMEARCKSKFVCKALCEGLPTFSADDMPEIVKQAAALKQQLKSVCEQIANTYGANIDAAVKKFIGEFGRLMEPEFVQKCSSN